MRAETNSWVISAEMLIEPERGEELPPMVVRIAVYQPDTEWQQAPHLRGKLIPPPELQGYEMAPRRHSASGTLFAYLDHVRRNSDAPFTSEQIAVLYDSIVSQVRVPVFGSPPKDWSSLASVIASGGVVGGVLSTGGEGHVAILSGVGIVVLLNVVNPASKALGEGLSYKIKRLLGLPEGNPPENDQPAVAPAPAYPDAGSSASPRAVAAGGPDEEDEEQ